MSAPSTSMALVIMAKAPQPGLAKTRLIPTLGASGAAQLARRLLAHTIDCARATQAYTHIELCVTPTVDHEAFATLASDITRTEQVAGDLGQRMQAAFERVLQRHAAAVMIGTDAPDLGAAHLDSAADALLHHDAVLTPALDGGYALIGLKRAWPSLFAEIPWGSDAVMGQTRQRLQLLGLQWQEQPAVRDIDRTPDLAQLPAHWLGEP